MYGGEVAGTIYLATSLHKLELENKSLKERPINQECQSRRDNLLFYGFKENAAEDCEKIVTLVSMDINEEIVRIGKGHRKGPKRRDHNRPIIVNLTGLGI